MEFNRGVAGVLVVVLSMIAAVALGVVTNIDTTTVQKDVDEYVADITGGFTAQKEQSYIDYTPASNYNGYTNNTYSNRFAVDFEPSNYTNNYPLTYTENPITFDIMNATASNIAWGGSSSTLEYDIYSIQSRTPQADYNTDFKFIKFTDLLPDIMPDNTTNLKYIEISISTAKDSVGNPTNTASITTGPNRLVFDESYGWLITPRLFGYTSEYIYEKAPYSNGTNSPFSQLILDSPSTEMCRIRYNVAEQSIAYYLGNEELITTSPAADAYVTGTHTIHDYYDGDFTTTSDIYVSYSYEDNTKYIDTRYGVSVRNSENVDWSNKQKNGVTSIAFSVWDDLTNTFTDTGSYSTTGTISCYNSATTDTFTVSRSSGKTYVSLNGGANVEIGTWNQIQLDIDTIHGKLTAYPILTWANFNDYALMGTSIEIGDLSKGDLEKISWTANDSFRFEVVNTRVFFNSYGVVLVDPYITISNLWPNYERFLVTFSKVASVGDSVTIGNVTYKIINNELNTVTIEDDVPIYTPTGIYATDLSIRYVKSDSGWDVTLYSDKNELTLNVPSTYIGMTGAWYFNSGFYQTVTKDVTERSWNPGEYDWFKGHMFFWMAGFVLLLGLGAYKLGYLDGISIIILIASEFILIIIGGAT